MFLLNRSFSMNNRYFMNIFIYIFIAFIHTSSYASSSFIAGEEVFLEVSFADEDSDGVDDEDDVCAGTPAGESVDASGCSESQKDEDNDGVFNNLDACPSTNEGVEVDENGCEISCSVSLSLSSGPLSQAILEGESITNVVYGFESDCSNLNINVIGLPNGVSWEGQANNIVISGQAEDTPGSYVYVVGIIKSEATASGEGPEAFIEGEIFIVGNDGQNQGDDEEDSGFTYVTDNGCEINVSNIPPTGLTLELCISEDFNEQIAVSSTCSDSNLTGEATGLPPGWSFSTSSDQNNNKIYNLVSGDEYVEGSYDLNIIFRDSSNNFINETLITMVFTSDCDSGYEEEGNEGPDGNENDGDQGDDEDESELIGTYVTADGCEITITSYNLFLGEIWEECVGDEPIGPYSERFVVSSTCSDGNISGEITGLPSGWNTTLSLDSKNNTILEIFPGDEVSNIGTYDLNFIITESSNNFINETSFTLVISSDCEDIDESDSENDLNTGDGNPDGNDNIYENTFQTDDGCEITIYNLPPSGSIDQLCSSEALTFYEQIIVSSTCSSSDIIGEVTGLPPGWAVDYGYDEYNNAIFTLSSLVGAATDSVEGTFNLNITIKESSSNFINETQLMIIITPDCVDFDDADQDGVPDEFDLCPDSKKGFDVDEFGCSREQDYSNNIVDSDNDGVSDAFDACPDTKEGSPTDSYGCSEDQLIGNESLADDDSDGIPNFYDLCPETDSDLEVDPFGCSNQQSPEEGTFSDSDSDGVPDEFDECPETEEGRRVDYFGCSSSEIPGESDTDDDDDDGVPNINDACPNSESGITVDFFGCSVNQITDESVLEDTDSDGIPDVFDACPKTARGELVNAFGCAEGQTPEDGSIVDTDEDGIPDVFDACPETEFGLEVSQFGCSDNQTPEEGTFKDSDSDGVPDDFDACPETSIDEDVNEFGCSYDASQEGKTFIPDNAFEQTLIDLGLDDLIDNYVDTEPLQYIKVLNLSSSERSDGSKIDDLTGLESFSGLTELIVSGNNLFFIDTYSIPYIQVLIADDNLISEIDTYDIPDIQKLSLNNNQLTFIDVSGIPSLTDLNIGNNAINSIDVSSSPEIERLRLNNTPIQNIDISSLDNLEYLEVINTDITCISVSEDQLTNIPQGWKINGTAFYSVECGYVSEFDTDNDGVENSNDLCPDTPNGQLVDENGCALVDSDSDLDGVVDEFDACPDTPENEYVNEYGCSDKQIDGDLDGIPNEFDECPESPIGIAVNENGCSEKEEKESEESADDDRDGVINSLDRCPETTAGTIVDEFGCTPSETVQQTDTDTDLDGVLNEDDLCPGTESGLAVDPFGCPLNESDSDYDKVSDDIDLCPNTEPGEEVDQYGCSIKQKEDDTDFDGIENSKDYCPNTAPYSKVNSNGCSEAQIDIDSDFDGVNNYDDQCPDTNPFEEVNENGCSVFQKDDDSDGVANGLDRCTTTPEGIKVDGYGCSAAQIDGDDDQDGVLNSIDKCPSSPIGTLIDNKGCPFLAPKIQSQVFEKTENSRDSIDSGIREYLGKIIVEDPNAQLAGDISNIALQIVDSEKSELFEIQNDSIFIVGRTDFEEEVKIYFQVRATNDKNLSAIANMELNVLDIPNTNTISSFELAVFNLEDETSSSKVDHTRYLNPKGEKGVGKWKIKKKITGGADASLFTIRSPEVQKNGEGESDDYLDFIVPPDFENPQDHNQDNIYEVEVVNVNTEDGDTNVPVVVTQNNLVVPEGNTTAIQLQTVAASPLDDTDGDGIVDILDNSPLVSNPDQLDSDGDGVGDVSDDADHDGVWNPFDNCADTPYGSLVDNSGCLIFYLPPNNFSISKTEKCRDTNSISLSVEDASITYQINISGAVNQTQTLSSSNWSLDNLSQGSYSICVTVDGVNASEFERCFDVTINEPQPLSVYSTSNKSDQTVSYKLNGGQNYSITHNGITKQTTASEYTVCLDKGVNTVSITTGIACQGIFEQSYFNSDTVVTAPNPFNESLAVFVGGEELNANIELYSNDGRTILVKQYSLTPTERTIYIDTSSLISGSYIVQVSNASVNQSQIVIKE